MVRPQTIGVPGKQWVPTLKVRPLTIGVSGKQWVPKDAVTKITKEWLLEKEMDILLFKLCGVWRDTKGSSYTLTQSANGDKLDVATERPNGVIHKTGGLVQVEWDGLYGRVVWGRGGRSRQYTIASFDCQMLKWQRAGSPDFLWDRVGELDETNSDVDELGAETASNDELNDEEYREVRNDTHLHRAKLRREFQQERRQTTELSVKAKTVDVHIPAKSVDGCEAGRKILAALQASKENVQVNAAVSIPQTSAAVIVDLQSNLKAMDATEILLEALKITPKNKPSQEYASTPHPVAYASAVPLQPIPAMLPEMQMYQYPLTPVDVSLVTTQVEFWFSDDNLVRDGHMRSLMNEQGWVYIGSLQSFRRMQQLNVDIWALRFALIPSAVLELDGSAQYVRIREQQRRERWISTARKAMIEVQMQ